MDPDQALLLRAAAALCWKRDTQHTRAVTAGVVEPVRYITAARSIEAGAALNDLILQYLRSLR